MRKFITAGVAIAMLAIPSAASADVPRCEAPVTTAATATFTAIEPADWENQWNNTWKHDYTVTVQPDGSFTGTGTQNGSNIWGAVMVDVPETISGKFSDSNADGKADTVNYTATRSSDGNEWYVTGASMDGTTETVATQKGTSATVKFKVTQPVFTAETTTDLNHGQYVKSQGGGKDAAKACAGMPLNSKQGK